LIDEQAEQEAAYEESLRSTSQPTANTDLTEQEKLQLEQQRLLDEQVEQEAAAYEESLRLANSSLKPHPKRRQVAYDCAIYPATCLWRIVDLA
jgi:hypothetical protein